MGTKIFKSTDQTAIASNSWVKVTFDKQHFLSSTEKALLGVDAVGFYDKSVNLTSNDAVIVTPGDYSHSANIRCTSSRVNVREKLREILERTDTGTLGIIYLGAGIARISTFKLAAYANKGTPTNPGSAWYGTNKITVSGATNPAYNITGNIVNFNQDTGTIDYDGIIGTPPSPDSATSATIQVAVGASTTIQGYSAVFSSSALQMIPLVGSGKLCALYPSDKIWLEFWHEETNNIDLFSGQFDCYMVFRRLK